MKERITNHYETNNSLDNNTEQESSFETFDDLKRQRQIIACLEKQDYSKLNQDDVNPDAETRENVLRRMASKNINDFNERALLRRIQNSPINQEDNSENIFENLSYTFDGMDDVDYNRQKYKMEILADATSSGIENWGNLDETQFDQFVEDYPTIKDFEKKQEHFLDFIKNNKPSEYQDYLEAMDEFEDQIYGEQIQYWYNIKHLREQAKQKYPNQPR